LGVASKNFSGKNTIPFSDMMRIPARKVLTKRFEMILKITLKDLNCQEI